MIEGKLTRTESVHQVGANRACDLSQVTFIVPILSGVLGILIPKDQYRLIPGKALKRLMFEWRLNPFAFFTAGKYHISDSTLKQRRGWKVTDM